MSEESAPAADAAPAESTEAKPAEVAKPDPKASLNEALKASGIKLKAKDREYIPRDIDDLQRRAERSFGLDAEIEAFKKDKTEADGVKKWRAAIESDDEAAAERAFDALSQKGQQAAAKWLQKKAQAWEEAQKLPPEALRERERASAAERELDQYRQKDATEKQRIEQEAHVKELRGAQEQVLKTITGVMGLFKADLTKAPRALAALGPFAARHMRAAMAAEAETGVAVDPQEIAANVRNDMAQGFAAVTEGMSDDDLYDSMGDKLVKRLLGAHLKRVKGIKPAAAGTQLATAPKPSNGANGPQRGTPAFLR